MTIRTLCVIFGLGGLLGAGVHAGAPQPDAILFGTITVNGQQLAAASDATMIARVEGVAQPVGVYRMGQSPTAGDNYVLRIRLETPVVASPVAPNAAQVGQELRIFVKLSDGAEGQVDSFTIPASGTIEQRNLDVTLLPGNCAADSQIDLLDHREFPSCLGGPQAAATAGCKCADTDGDNDVDLRDWSRMQAAFTSGS